MNNKSFSLFMVDHDKKLFNIIEDLSDDRYYNDLVVMAQEEKRDVRCFSTYEPQFAAKAELESMGYTYTRQSVVTLLHDV